MISKNPRIFAKSVNDFLEGFYKWRIWARLAWMAVLEQYRRSTIGPLWLSINTLILVVALGLVYGRLLNLEISKHLPYVSTGLVIWYLYSKIIVQGCAVFISNRQMIQQIPLPHSVYLYRLIAQELIIFFHNILVIIVVFIFFRYGITVYALLSILALVLIVINAASLALLFGVISTRYRDFPPIIQAIIQPMMLLTPIIWNAESFPDRAAFIYLNPFYHIVEIWRDPLLGELPSKNSWIIVSVLTLLFAMTAFLFFSKYRKRISYWV